MTNDERSPKSEFPKAPASRGWRSKTMNLEWVRLGRQGAAHVSAAELVSVSPAGKMPAAPCGSWKAIVCFRSCIGTMNPPPAPRRGAAWRGQFPSPPPRRAIASLRRDGGWEGSGVGLSPTGSWRAIVTVRWLSTNRATVLDHGVIRISCFVILSGLVIRHLSFFTAR